MTPYSVESSFPFLGHLSFPVSTNYPCTGIKLDQAGRGLPPSFTGLDTGLGQRPLARQTLLVSVKEQQ